MRQFMNLVTESVLPVTVYHGTNRRVWETKATHGEPLYLTVNRDDAENYAEEAYVSAHDHEDPAYFDPEIAPIVVEFNLNDLLALGLEFHPDFGWDGASNDTTWRESLAAVGSFCVTGFTQIHKGHGKVQSL